MASYNFGKDEIVKWIKDRFPEGSTCLDVGACDGIWSDLLRHHLEMYACEIWKPNVDRIASKYEVVFWTDISLLFYPYYDLVIFGDVLEHMSVEKAQKVLEYAKDHCKDYIVAVPFMYSQGELYGNPYEKHIQNDLNDKTIAERYPQLELILKPTNDYAYYHAKG